MNKLIKPLLLLVILLAAWIVIRRVSDRPDRPGRDDIFAVEIDEAAVSRMEISRAGESLTLQRAGEGWTVVTDQGPKPADQAQVTSALSSLGGIRTTNLVSHNPDRQAEFQVDEAQGTRVRIFGQGDRPDTDLIIGKIGGFNQREIYSQRGINPQDFFTFMRSADSERVYRVQGFFGGFLGTDAEQWRDHNLMSFSPDQALRLELEYPESAVALARDTEGVWRMLRPEEAEADGEVVRQMLNTLSVMRASGFGDNVPEDSLGLTVPRLTVRVQLEDGTAFGLEVGAEIEDNLFYCRVPGEPQVYTLARYRLDQVEKSPQELIRKEDPERDE